MARKRGTQHRRRNRRGRTTARRADPGSPPMSELLETSAERSRHRNRGWEWHTWGDGRSTAWERRSGAAWAMRAFELGGIARQRLLRSIAIDVVVVVAVVVVAVVVVAVAR